MNRIALVTIALNLAVSSGYAADQQPDEERYVFPLSKLSIPKQLDSLKLVNVIEFKEDGSDVVVKFSDPERGLDISLYVYKSPPSTKGPTFVLDSEGKKILEDRKDVIKQKNAVFKLNPPSKSFEEEYALRLYAIKMQGFSLASEYRYMAVPTRNDSPIAYAAVLKGNITMEGDSIPYIWKTYLYSLPGFFVKIHCTYPEQLWLEVGAIDVKFIQALNWEDFLSGKEEISDDTQLGTD